MAAGQTSWGSGQADKDARVRCVVGRCGATWGPGCRTGRPDERRGGEGGEAGEKEGRVAVRRDRGGDGLKKPTTGGVCDHNPPLPSHVSAYEAPPAATGPVGPPTAALPPPPPECNHASPPDAPARRPPHAPRPAAGPALQGQRPLGDPASRLSPTSPMTICRPPPVPPPRPISHGGVWCGVVANGGGWAAAGGLLATTRAGRPACRAHRLLSTSVTGPAPHPLTPHRHGRAGARQSG